MDSKEFIKLVSNVIKVDVRNARIEANKKGVVHDEIRVRQVLFDEGKDLGADGFRGGHD
jgi:stress response protein YsnF